uniref:Uncharacterized protein n=1 Tax=Myoviridae sp. ct2DO6 TaxID=2825020 RepID=A0A8S5Q2J6_9CAUD|nr:MAG TPA: hypothetical protein [Myoviridae sp. ct2DO6]
MTDHGYFVIVGYEHNRIRSPLGLTAAKGEKGIR